MKHFIIPLLLLFACLGAGATEANEDTPNLSFEMGNFSNWQIYTGNYYFNTEDSTYTYSWTPESDQSDRIKIMNSMNTLDPVIACSNMYVVPEDLQLTARLGDPDVAEGYGRVAGGSYGSNAAAEKMVYTFVVTENSTLLNYRFALALADPANTGNAHTGPQRPSFSVKIRVVSPEGIESTLPCGGFSASSNEDNATLEANPSNCTTSQASKPDYYFFKNWTSASVNLQKFIGYTVTIEVVNHDCLSTSANNAGSHAAHGYFWAETRKLELITKNCGENDPVITASEGFTKYVWSRSDGKSITTKTGSPNIAIIPRSTVAPDVTYTCEMSSDLCSAGSVTTDLKAVDVKPSFDFTTDCGGKVTFTNTSTATGDSINGYTWDFADDSYSQKDNPEHTYKISDSYSVKLHATTKMGCEDSITKPVVVPYFPELEIDGNTTYCYGEKFSLTVLNAQVGSSITWDNGAIGETIEDVATTSKYYTVTVTDEYHCTYDAQVYVAVRPTPTVSITGSKTVCKGDTATLVAHNALSYVWSNGTSETGDNEDESLDTSVVKVRPLVPTTYTVTGTASNGCKAKASVTVDVLSLPEISIDGPDEICDGTSATLTASGADSYYWSDLFSGAERDVTPNKTMTYTVKGTDLNNCSSNASKSVRVKSNPELAFDGDTLVCQGEIARIQVSGAHEFVWADGTVRNYYTQVMENDDVWSVTGTTEGCSSTISIPIKIKPSPYVYINGIPEVCLGDTLTLTAAGAETYKWASGENTASITKTPTVSSTYQVSGTGSNGCTSVENINVTVLDLPTISIVGESNVCQNTLAHLKAVGNATVYYWSNGSIGDSITPLINERTTFTVEGVDMNTCRSKATFDVGIITPPSLAYTGTTEVCAGNSVMLAVTGAATYEWYNGSKASYYSGVPTMDTVYTVTGNLNGCLATLSIPITVLSSPVIWTEGINEVCSGDTFSLTAKGAKTYVWSNGTNSDVLTATAINSSVYKLIGTDANGCSTTIEVPVTVRTKPAITVTGDYEVCVGTAATIEASGDCVLYSWDNGSVGSVIYPVINKASVFTVTGTDKYNCTNTAMYSVTPVNPPTLSFLGDTVVCNGGTVTLVGQGATDYIWNGSLASPEFTITPTTNTYVKLSGTAHNCTSEITIQISVNTPPNILISGDTAVCPGDNFTITAAGAETYKWSTGETDASISYAPMVTTTYYVTGYDEFGCSTMKAYTVGVRKTPTIYIEQLSSNGCPGSKDTIVLQGNGGIYYEWTSEPSLPELDKNVNSDKVTLLLDDTTTIHLYGRDVYGCSNVDEMTIKPLPRVTIDFTIDPAWIDDSNPTVSFKGTTPTDAEWYWTPEPDADELVGRIAHYRYNVDDLSDSVLVSVKAVDNSGCKYTGESYLYVWKDFWAPTGFTPNKDEKNETFHFYGGQYIEDFNFYIYNRLGEIVFEGKSFDDEWDGTYNGKPCPWGTYGWVANYKSNLRGLKKDGQKVGKITIVR